MEGAAIPSVAGMELIVIAAIARSRTTWMKLTASRATARAAAREVAEHRRRLALWSMMVFASNTVAASETLPPRLFVVAAGDLRSLVEWGPRGIYGSLAEWWS